MPNRHPFVPSGHGGSCQPPAQTPRLALNEGELAGRWRISVKSLRRWRQLHLGPVFCKLGARVTYPVNEVEAFERRNARCSTSARAYA